MQDRLRVADSGGQSDALNVFVTESAQSLQQGRKVPAPIVAGEGVDFVDNHGAEVGKHPLCGHTSAHQHDFQRLGRGQQDVRRVIQKRIFPARGDITVPFERASPDQARVALHARLLVVEQSPDRRHVHHGNRPPVLRVHLREQGKERRLCLAPGRGSKNHNVLAVQHRGDGQFLDRAEILEPQSVHDLVLERRAQSVEGCAHAGFPDPPPPPFPPSSRSS